MIKSFRDEASEKLFVAGQHDKLPSHIVRRALRALAYLDAATSLRDLRSVPGNRLHKLRADRRGQWSIAINDRWRVCFEFEHGNAFNVEIADYHG